MRSAFRWATALALASMMLTACDPPSPGNPDAGDRADGGAPDSGEVSLVLSPTSARTAAGGDTVRLTAVIFGGTGEITWALYGPGSLSATRGASTTYTPPACLDVESTATVTAAAAGKSATARITIEPEACGTDHGTVRGSVIDERGAPVPDVKVLVVGHPVVTSDASGRFTVPDVAVPYDLAAVVGAPEPMAVVYKGVRRLDPKISGVGRPPSAVRTATVFGSLGGLSGMPLPPDRRLGLVLAAPEATSYLAPMASADYKLEVVWPDASTLEGTVHALEWQVDAMNLPLAYQHASRGGIALTQRATLHNQDLVLAPVPTSTLSGTVSMPDDYRLDSRRCLVHFGAGDPIEVARQAPSEEPLSSGFSFVLPKVPGARARLELKATSADGGATLATRNGSAADMTNLAIDLPSASTPLAPADQATDVDATTVFQWSGGTGLAGLFLVPKTGDGLQFAVFTTEATATLPDLSALGAALPRSAKLVWLVANFAEVADVTSYLGGPPSQERTTLTHSAMRALTTAP